MTSKVHGYIELPAQAVFEAGTAYLENRKKRQEEAKQKAIQYEMTKRWFPAKTEQQADDNCREIFGHTYDLGGGYWAQIVKSVTDQAATAMKYGGVITISDDVHDCIGDYLL